MDINKSTDFEKGIQDILDSSDGDNSSRQVEQKSDPLSKKNSETLSVKKRDDSIVPPWIELFVRIGAIILVLFLLYLFVTNIISR